MKLRFRGNAPLSPLWAIEPIFAQSAMEEMERLEARAPVATGRKFSDETLRAIDKFLAEKQAAGMIEAASSNRYSDDGADYQIINGIAFIEISGPMTKKPSCYSWYYGGTSTIEVRQDLRDAIKDSKVRGVMLIIESPGGEVAGTAELAADILRLQVEKPIFAYADDLLCSAALWVASACTKTFANSTAMVGSAGVIWAVKDSSEAASRAGVKVHVIATSEHKGAGTPGTVVTDAHRAEFQRNIDSVGAQFSAALKANRNLTDDQLAAVFDARVHVGEEAVALHLVDGICSLDECVVKLMDAADARATSTAGQKAGIQEKPIMRTQLATALAAIGMSTVAARILGAKDDTPESVGPELAGGVSAEVKAQKENDPLFKALNAAGITTPEQVATLSKRAGYGDQYVSSLREAAKAAAVTAYGVDTAIGKASVDGANAMIDQAEPELLKSITGQYAAMAEKLGLQSADGTPMQRQSAAPKLNTAADANPGAQQESQVAKTGINSGNVYSERAKQTSRRR